MQFTLIQQNDTHGCLESHSELFWKGHEATLKKVGGFPKISHYLNQVRNEKENVLVFDGGDLFHGTLPLVATKGEAIVPILKKLNLDGFVPGNWDYAYGKEQLRKLVDAVGVSALACNVMDQDTNELFVEPYMVKELEGIKIGIIGLTYPYVDITMPAKFSEGLQFSKGVEEVRQAVETLKDSCDVIILVSHMGLPLDSKLVSLVNGIDIVLSGHSHDRVQEPIILNDTYIVQAGSSSSFLGRLDVTFEKGSITGIKYDLVVMDETMGEDEEMKELVDQILSGYEKERSTRVGETNTLLHRMTLEEAPMDKLITDAYLSHFEADAAFSHGWRYGTPFAPGPLTLFDLHTIIPTNPELFTLELTGEELWQALEHNLEQVYSSDPFEQKGGYVLRSSGLAMTFKPYNPEGHRIQTLQIKGADVQPDQKYKVIGGGKQSFKKHEEKKDYQGVKAIEVLQTYLKEKGPYVMQDQSCVFSV